MRPLSCSAGITLIARWLILADDLTGAADAGVAFARRGWAAEVSWGDGASEADVLALDADTRHRPADAAGAAHVDLLRAQRTPGARLFKKIDSTLRGQPAAEIASLLGALRQAGQLAMAVVAPAFPATGRTTVSGRMWLHGAPLEASPLWARDHSYRDADLCAVLASAGVSTRLLDLGAVRGDAEGALRAARADGVEAVICDALEPSDLEALAQAGLRLGESILWVGSAGLATALAAVLPAGTAPAIAVPPTQAGTLIVIGSLAAASREAASWLEEGGTATWDVTPHWLMERDPRVETLAEAVEVKLAAGCNALVRIRADAHSASGELARALAQALAPALCRMGALFATGGETARALLERSGARSLRLLDEVEPGVPLAITVGALRVPVVTKAGAFGDAGTISRSLERLRQLRSRQNV